MSEFGEDFSEQFAAAEERLKQAVITGPRVVVHDDLTLEIEERRVVHESKKILITLSRIDNKIKLTREQALDLAVELVRVAKGVGRS